jgi:predicted membrane chloride channel (bestrophin family)
MNAAHKWLLAIVCVGAFILAVSYIGYVKSYFDEASQITFFIKRHPALQMEFYSPFGSEGDDVPVNQLSQPDLARFADYCKYRFGIKDRSIQALEVCKKLK